jgi:putative endonuclease
MTAMTASDLRRVALGAYGEAVAERHLTELGMVVLDRNWRCSAGEIDLVLRDGQVLVICEVKTRTSDQCGAPLEAVTASKVRRMQRLSGLWIERHGVRVADVRLDMVGVLRPLRGPARIEHVQGIG